MKKKIISFVLAICLIIPCIVMLSACGPKPTYVNVSSMEELSAALTNDIDNDIIVLEVDLDLKDVNNNTALKIESGKHVLDLNGHTLKGVDNGSNSWHAIDVRGNETQLTIKDTSAEKTGTIYGRCYGIQVSRGAKLVIDGGNFVCTQNGSFNQSVVVYGGELVINGGKFTSKVGEIINSASYIWNTVDYHSSVTINGGEFNSISTETDGALFVFEKGEYSQSTDIQTVVINGGTFNNNNLQYVVIYDSNVDFTNNANIPAEKISNY